MVAALMVYFGVTRLVHAPSKRLMIAVLPFANLSGDPSQEYFSDGLTEEAITQLSKLDSERLGVISRTSTMAYKSRPADARLVGRELGVEYFLEGSVRREGDRVRVAVQLIRCSDGTHVWADTYDDRIQDVLSLQARLATEVAGQIRLTLGHGLEAAGRMARPPVDPIAYEAVLRGRFYWNRRSDDDLKRAVEQFTNAIKSDPRYAPAYAGLAASFALLGQYGVVPPVDAFSKSREAATEAVRLDPTLPDAHASLPLVHILHAYDWNAAEREFLRAIALNPDYASARQWYSEYLIATRRPSEARVQMGKAQQADPNSLIISMAAGRPLYYSGQYDLAIQQFQRTLERDPTFFPAHAMLGLTYQQKGMFAQG